MYKFKKILGDSISENHNIYIYVCVCVSLALTTLSRRLKMHLSDTSSIAQHIKNIYAQQQNYGKVLPKEQQY